MAAANKNKAADAIVKAQTNSTDNRPAGIARVAVRGLRASIFRSAMRLKAIAVDLAPTIATIIHKNCLSVGNPLAAKTAPKNANGKAKSVCSIFIISRVRRVFFTIVDTAGGAADFVCNGLPKSYLRGVRIASEPFN